MENFNCGASVHLEINLKLHRSWFWSSRGWSRSWWSSLIRRAPTLVLLLLLLQPVTSLGKESRATLQISHKLAQIFKRPNWLKSLKRPNWIKSRPPVEGKSYQQIPPYMWIAKDGKQMRRDHNWHHNWQCFDLVWYGGQGCRRKALWW